MPLTVTRPCEPLVGTVLFWGHHYFSCCAGTKHPFLQVFSVAERPAQRELSERPQSNRMSLCGCCGMSCEEALTWFRGGIAPFLLSHQPRILHGAQVLLLTITCFTVDSALPACNIDLDGGLYQFTRNNTASASESIDQFPPGGKKKTYQFTPVQLQTDLSHQVHRSALQPCGLHVHSS